MGKLMCQTRDVGYHVQADKESVEQPKSLFQQKMNNRIRMVAKE